MSKNLSAIIAHCALILAVIIVIGILGSIASASQSTGAEKFTGEIERGATIRVLENDTAIKQGYFSELIDAFNSEYKEYNIKVVDANMDQYTDLENDGPYGYGPDVLYQANDRIMRYPSGRHVLPLPVEEFDCYDQISEKGWQAYKQTVGGQEYTFGVPVNVQGPLLYYRKDLLPENWEQEWDDDKNGVPDMIEYWTDMYRYSKQVKENSSGTKYGYMRSFLEPYFSVGYLYSYGGYSFGNNNTNPSDIGHSAGNAELGGRIIRQLASVMDERCIDDSVTTGAYAAIASGEFFATITTPDVYTMFVDEMKAAGYSDEYIAQNLVTTYIPKLPVSGNLEDESQGFIESNMMGGVQGYAVSSYTKYPNASLAFVKFAASYNMIKRRNELLGIVPARKDVADEVGGLSEVINNNLENGNITVMPSIKENAQMWTPLQTLFQDLAKDAFRNGSEVKYDTLESIKDALKKVDQQIYDGIFTLQ
ncbi:MAG: extracellular solute-binding protein [Clostridia bacterium]|nr:extracellular solute-binding protein [Clostridia bacterium]